MEIITHAIEVFQQLTWRLNGERRSIDSASPLRNNIVLFSRKTQASRTGCGEENIIVVFGSGIL